MRSTKFKLPKLNLIAAMLGLLIAGGFTWRMLRADTDAVPRDVALPPAEARAGSAPVKWPAPQFSFPDQDGGDVSSASLRGKVTIVDFIFTSYPNNDLIVVQQGELLTMIGRAEEGVAWIKKAMRLNPYHPERFWGHLGRAFLVARRYREAIDAFRRISTPDQAVSAYLAASFAHVGDEEGAQKVAAAILESQPAFTVESHLRTLLYRLDEDRAHLCEGMLKAGLPKGA